MGVFKRFSDIVNSNLNAMLDKAEDPQKLLRLMISEMEETLADARSDAAAIIADKKSFQREIRELEIQSKSWQEKAQLAVNKDKDELARGALKEKKTCDEKSEICKNALVEVEKALNTLESDMERLQAKLDEAQAKQLSYEKRIQSLQQTKQIRQVSHQSRVENTMQKLDRFHRKLDRMEAEVESYDFAQKPSQNRPLAQQIDDLGSDEALEAELQSLKENAVKKAS